MYTILEFARLNKIDIDPSPCNTRFLLNYGIRTAPELKTHKLARLCRALMVDEAGNVISKSFTRFFNAGEPGTPDDFDWDHFSTYSKEDGSLAVLYYDMNQWRMHTRRGFGGGLVHDSGISWHNLFFSTLPRQDLDFLDKSYSYSFELCSPYNQIVCRYDQPTLFLLAAHRNILGDDELSDDELDIVAAKLGVSRPQRFTFRGFDDISQYVEDNGDLLYEGFVVKDDKGRRLKIKTPRYLQFHKMFSFSGTKAVRRTIVDLVLANDIDEVLTYFPHIHPIYADVMEHIGSIKRYIEHERPLFNLPSDKEFALAVADSPYRHMMFYLRKTHGGQIDDETVHDTLSEFRKLLYTVS